MTAVERTALQRNASSRSARGGGGKRLEAPFSLRCGALLIDYIALASIIVIATLIARLLGGGARSAGSSAEAIGVVVAVVMAILNFGLVAGLTGLTLGKWATGLRIVRNNGGNVGIFRALLRHFIGYPLSLMTLGLGFLMAVLAVRGRALHDIIAGTIVVREGSF